MKKLNKLALSALALLTTASAGSTLPVKAQEERHYTAFIANPGVEISENTRINDAFAEEFGWRVKVTWLTGQTAKERIGVMVAGGEYPDIVEPSDARSAMIDADRKSTRLNSSHVSISYAVFCLKKKKKVT